MSAPKPLCVCGGSYTQHTLVDPTLPGCWGQCCASKAAPCLTYRARVASPEALAKMSPQKRKERQIQIDRELNNLKAGSIRKSVYDAIAQSGVLGMTDDDIELRLHRSHQSVSSARHTLGADGLIEDSGRRRRTRYGRQATVWVTVGLANV